MLRTIAQDLSQLSLLPQPTTPQAIPSGYPHPGYADGYADVLRIFLRICSSGYADVTTYHAPTPDQLWCHPSRLTPHASSIKHLSIRTRSTHTHTAHTHTQHPSLKSRVKGLMSRIELMLSFKSQSSSSSLRIHQVMRSEILLPRVCNCSSAAVVVLWLLGPCGLKDQLFEQARVVH